MERYYSIENLRKQGKYAYKNAYCFPVMSFLSQFIDSYELNILIEKFEEMSKKEIFDFLGISESEYETILKYFLLKSISKGVAWFGILALDVFVAKCVFDELNLSGVIYLRAKDIDDLDDALKIFKKGEIQLGLSVDPYFAGDDLSSKISLLAGQHKLPVVLTMFDDLDKTGMINSIFNVLPVNYIENLGFLDRDCSIYGGVCADKEDFNLLASYGTKMIVSPYESMSFGRGSPNVYAMLNCELDVSLCAPTGFDIEKEIEMTSVLGRGNLSDAQILPIDEVLEIAISKEARKEFDKKELEEYEKQTTEIWKKIKEKI